MKNKPYGKGKKWRVRGKDKTTHWERGVLNPSHKLRELYLIGLKLKGVLKS